MPEWPLLTISFLLFGWRNPKFQLADASIFEVTPVKLIEKLGQEALFFGLAKLAVCKAKFEPLAFKRDVNLKI